MLNDRVKSFLLLGAPQQSKCPPEFPFAVFVRTLPDYELRVQRNRLAGQELDLQAIRERYLNSVELAHYSRRLFVRRWSNILLAAAAGGLCAWNALERVLDWVEYEVYIK
mmetsp:Transcript_15934/g.29163  ORF Transcript_15934/g.29163 Transcript_15934/m.29163 type:complete len:110 (+) Transcript_15934:17-346(+)